MAVLYIVENPGATTEFYDKVRARLKDEEAPRGGLFHVAAKTEDGGLLVLEVWESEADREQWSQKVDKAIEEIGGPKRPQPRILEVHSIRTAEAMTAT
jgi:heme-degrading monooxygenase HmoA